MATIVATASGGTRVWSDTATWVGGVVPGADSDVQLNGTSGAVTIDTGALCRSLDCTGYTGTLTHNAITLTVGDGTAGAGNVALKLVSGMTYTLISAASAINFISTSATQQTIATGTKNLGNWTINGVGSSYLLADANSVTGGVVTLTSGTLDTNSQACNWSGFASSGAVARTLTMGSSAFTIGANAWGTTNFTNLTITANTAVITLNATDAVMSPGNNTINYNGTSLVFSGAGNALISHGGAGSIITFASVTRTGTSVKTDALSITSGTGSGGLVCTGSFICNGQSLTNRVLLKSVTLGSPVKITAASVTLSNTDFMDVTAAGAAAPFTGTSMGNAQGNTSITFTVATTQTHTSSAGGNWSDVTKWTSRVPLPQDNVIVNGSTTGTITADMPRLGANITCTGFVGTASFTSIDTTIYGSWVSGAGMTIAGTQNMFLAGRSAHTITCNGKNFSQWIQIVGNGTYTLADPFVSAGSGALTTSALGTFNTAGFNITVPWMSCRGTVTLGSSTVTVTMAAGQTFEAISTSTLSAASSTIVIGTASASTRIFEGGGKTFGTVTYTVAGSTGAWNILSANTFNTINFSDATNARTLTLPASTTTTINGRFNVNGTAGKLMTINSSSTGTPATLAGSGGTVTVDYVSLQDSAASTGTFYAGSHSTDVSGNTGWTFADFSSYILASASGGTRLWSDTATWVGGVVPTTSSDVRLDATSGAVTIDSGAVCRSLDCTGFVGTLTHNAITLTIGDGTGGINNVALKLASGMTYTLLDATASAITFASTSTAQQTITSSFKVLGNMTVNGVASSYILSDSLAMDFATLVLQNGTFNLNNIGFSVYILQFAATGTRTLTMGSSSNFIQGTSSSALVSSGGTTTITANTATIVFTGGTSGVNAGLDFNGMSATFSASVTTGSLSGGPTFKNLTVTGPSSKVGSFTIAGSVTVTGTLTVTGNSAINRIYFKSATLGTAATVSVGVSSSISNVDFQDITAAGAAGTWNGGSTTGNCLGNTNITTAVAITQTRTATVGGNWSDVTKWSAVPPPASRVPLPQDDVIINGSTTGTITIDMPRIGNTITFTGFAGTASFTSTSNAMFGSWVAGAGMTISGTQPLSLLARSSKTITSNSKQFSQAVAVSGPGG